MDNTELAALILAAMAFIAGVIVGRATALTERRRGGKPPHEREDESPREVVRAVLDRSVQSRAGVPLRDAACSAT